MVKPRPFQWENDDKHIVLWGASGNMSQKTMKITIFSGQPN